MNERQTPDTGSNLMRMCLNWKVLAGLAVVGAGIWVYAPGLAAAVLPLLVLAACPLAMLLMMRGLNGGQVQAHGPVAVAPEATDSLELRAMLTRLEAEAEELRADIARLEDSPSPNGQPEGVTSGEPSPA